MERLQVPPIRTPLAEGNGQSAGRDPGTAKTAKEWYLYWRQAGEQVNTHADSIGELDAAVEGITGELEELTKNLDGIIRYGAHAQRIVVAPDPAGALWVETDRQNIVYQAQTVAGAAKWVYVTGAMYGTILAADQRPAGLGVNDKGLLFLSSDSRSVRWTGSSWGPLDYLETNAVIGAPGLTHPNVVTKVGAAGQIAEGGITDLSAANSNTVYIDAAGKVAINTTAGMTERLTVNGLVSLRHVAGTGAGMWLDSPFATAQMFVGAEPALATGWRIYGAPVGRNVITVDLQSGNVGINTSGPVYNLQLVVDSAAKPLTSTWAVVSDLRLKQNIEPAQDDSLAILEKLEWVRYELNGQAETPKGAKGIGLVAQSLREQLPEAVRSAKTKLTETDDAETDVLAIDYHHILVHSARAIQQLTAEVRRLGALIGKPPS